MPTAIVVGAGPGIGAAIARRLAREGLAIGAVARSEASVAAALSSLAGEQTLGLPADVTDAPSLHRALDVIVARFGVPDVLVYNATAVREAPIVDLLAEQHLTSWGVDVGGAITAVAHLAPRMAQAGRGTILLTGRTPAPAAECASLPLARASARTLTNLLATAFGPSGIHVATLIVAGVPAPGAAYDPDAIAEHYWRLHVQRPAAWKHDFVFTGEA